MENSPHYEHGDVRSVSFNRHLTPPSMMHCCVTSKLTNNSLAAIREEIKNGVPEIKNTFPLNSSMMNKPVALSFSERSAHSWPQQTIAAQTVRRERWCSLCPMVFPWLLTSRRLCLLILAYFFFMTFVQVASQKAGEKRLWSAWAQSPVCFLNSWLFSAITEKIHFYSEYQHRSLTFVPCYMQIINPWKQYFHTMKGRKQDHYLGINLLPGQQNTQSQLIVTKKASDNIVSLSALSPNRGLAFTNASTEAGLRAYAKLGGWWQRQSFCSPSSRFQRNEEATRINTMGPEEPAACKVVWSPNTYRDFQIRHVLKTNISQLLNMQP